MVMGRYSRAVQCGTIRFKPVQSYMVVPVQSGTHPFRDVPIVPVTMYRSVGVYRMSGIKLSRADMMEAVSEGVRRAMWEMITNATQMPCADFFASITEGVEQAHAKFGDVTRIAP